MFLKNDFKILSNSETKQILKIVPYELFKIATVLAVKHKDIIYIVKVRPSYEVQKGDYILISKRKYELMSVSEKEGLAGQYILFDITGSYFKFED